MKKEVSENSVKSYCKFLSRKHELSVLNRWVRLKYNAFVNLYPELSKKICSIFQSAVVLLNLQIQPVFQHIIDTVFHFHRKTLNTSTMRSTRIDHFNGVCTFRRHYAGSRPRIVFSVYIKHVISFLLKPFIDVLHELRVEFHFDSFRHCKAEFNITGVF